MAKGNQRDLVTAFNKRRAAREAKPAHPIITSLEQQLDQINQTLKDSGLKDTFSLSVTTYEENKRPPAVTIYLGERKVAMLHLDGASAFRVAAGNGRNAQPFRAVHTAMEKLAEYMDESVPE